MIFLRCCLPQDNANFLKIIFTMNEMNKFLGLKNKIYFNRTEDIILQSQLNPEAQVFVPSVKVCISTKQV